MSTGAFDNAVDRQLAAIKAGLVEECENIASSREISLRLENDSLREEIALLRQQLSVGKDSAGQGSPTRKFEHEALHGVADAGVTLPAVATEVQVASPGIKEPMTPSNKGQLEGSPEIVAVANLGGLALHDGFWSRNAARPDHDHGFCLIDDDVEVTAPTSTKDNMFILDPTGNLKLCWDVLGIPVLAWDLITIPMQVFGIEDASVMVGMSWVTLLFWSMDIPCCFLTGYFDNEGEIILEQKKIIHHYLRSTFGLDALIIGADWLSIILEAITDGAPGFLSNVAILRALRITRFARLMRLRKLKAKWQTVEDNIESEWFLVCLNLFSKIMIILAVTHYVGCVFFWLGTVRMVGYDTWLSTPWFQYKMPGLEQQTMKESPWEYQYVTAVHWAMTQFTPGSMHVQAQNIPERIFAVFCLLFGMVVFSAFIANVTQARIQLNKMMSKFDRDMWLLRKYCRQMKISHQLTVRMRRYVDLVLIPKFQKMGAKDVVLLPQLSGHLREELQTEIESRKLAVHPFFKVLQKNKAAMNKICNTAIDNIVVALGDVVFPSGSMVGLMYIITGGILDYIPHSKRHDQDRLRTDRWVCEASLWTKWVTQGQMQGAIESTVCSVHAVKFRNTLSENPLHMNFARHYAQGFLDRLNHSWQVNGVPSDLQEEASLAQFDESMKVMGHRAPTVVHVAQANKPQLYVDGDGSSSKVEPTSSPDAAANNDGANASSEASEPAETPHLLADASKGQPPKADYPGQKWI